MAVKGAELAKSRGESLMRISKDWVDVASSLESKKAARSFRDLNHPPAVKKAMRSAGIALAVAPEPVTTVAGVALVAGSLAMKDEPATLRSMGKELESQISELSTSGLKDLTISFAQTD